MLLPDPCLSALASFGGVCPARPHRRVQVTATRRTVPMSLATRRHMSSDAEPAAAYSPKIDAIVDEVEKLTLVEVAELVSALKV